MTAPQSERVAGVARSPEAQNAHRFGLFVCYECRDDRCDHCIGIPCMCPCPIPLTEPEYFI